LRSSENPNAGQFFLVAFRLFSVKKRKKIQLIIGHEIKYTLLKINHFINSKWVQLSNANI